MPMDFEKTAKKVLGEAGHVAAKARKAAGQVTHKNRDKIDAALTKAGSFVDAKTDGKYAHHIDKAKRAAGKGVEFVAQQKDATVPPRPGKTAAHASRHSGPNAGWDDAPADMAPPVGEQPHPSPIPPYEPPTHH